jgi:isoleucyl-tRNA synthetase
MAEKTQYYPESSANPDFAKQEDNILALWEDGHIFEQSVEQRAGENDYVFYDGPPFANGLPHYGHLLTGYVKDLVARFQTMKGNKVERRFGWDCHGLPAEMGAEKELGISGRHKIVEYGIENFNKQCETSVMKFSGEWEKYVTRQARWVDFKHDYKTMNIEYMESVLWAFKQLHDKGLVYESMRVMPYSWACETPLSNFETRMDNAYREKTSKAITVAFELDEVPKGAPEGCESYRLLAWTTTPWTLPSNLALAIGEGIEYACVIKEGVCNILAASSISSYAKELGVEEGQELHKVQGTDLAGLTYKPLLPYFADKKDEGAFRVLVADFVEEGDGTGIVHIAPGFGEDDFALCQGAGVPLVCPVDNGGKFTAEVPDFNGTQVFEANDPIIIKLKEQGSWLKTDQYIHSYPHCWRTDTPLIYKAVPSWYVEVTKFKDRMVELNQEINWIPGHVKDGLFGKWLENARDWSISRNRFWGAPIPVWKSDNPNNKKDYVFGSIKELEEFFGVEVKDLHRPFIDTLTKPDPEDSNYTLRRVEDVFDCWFESGSMPYAQVHYPFENKEWFESHFPADFIVEYMAQTRGWFYTLVVLSTALFDRIPFKNVICHGVVLDGKGQKLSKRLNNYADPMALFDKYGSDALRWVMVSSPIMHGGELLIDKEGNMVRDAVRLVMKPVWNAYHFFTLYANADGIQAGFDAGSQNVMDRYILSKCRAAAEDVDSALSAYDVPVACKAVEDFFEVLNNWYIRRNKDRFWKEEKDTDKQVAYNTLYTVLHVMSRAFAPLLPLLSEQVWRGLVGEKEDSVHLQLFPNVVGMPEDRALTVQMDKVRDACNAGLSVRNAENIRVRQPLAKLTLVTAGAGALAAFSDIIKDEINVKEVVLEEEVAAFADFKLKINFPVLGKRLPAKMKQIIPASKKGEWERLADGRIEICGEVLESAECAFLLDPKEKKGTQALSTNDALVVLDLDVSDELKREGIARDVVRFIQQSRKEADLTITDRIALKVVTDNVDVRAAVSGFAEYISKQTLAVSVDVADAADSRYSFKQKLDGQDVAIGFDVAA